MLTAHLRWDKIGILIFNFANGINYMGYEQSYMAEGKKGLDQKTGELLRGLDQNLSGIPLTEEGEYFANKVKDFLRNPQKYIKEGITVPLVEQNVSKEKLTLDESDQKVVDFIEKAISEGKEIWYQSYPDPDGYFWDDKKTSKIDTNSFYVMTKKPNAFKAEFMILPREGKYATDMTLNAVSSWRAYVLPVCEINNKVVVGPNETGVIQHKPGILKRDNDNENK